jgi:hypothetical protein
MFADDHNPPHFHIKYGNYQAIFMINKGIIRGEIPVKVAKAVSAWMEIHKDELLSNWEKLQKGISPNTIKPLN